ncbi:Leucine-rich repeat-containing protein [Artemisia annua]|uniref:Leucine-rich repeat-containing protein n=1 Tax=Artemisia annua TaxID=35608 RepID=A0A2U1N7D3_ARTAN|nr:Leucine-rich repeat-containing protein [Artemisia annua]
MSKSSVDYKSRKYTSSIVGTTLPESSDDNLIIKRLYTRIDTSIGDFSPRSLAYSTSFTESRYAIPPMPLPSPTPTHYPLRELLSSRRSGHLRDAITHSEGAESSPRREIENGYQVHLSLTMLDNNYFGIYLGEALDRAGLRCNTESSPREMRASVIVLTEGSATYIPCLNLLLESLEERRNSNHFVLPVFYHTEPSYIIQHGKDLLVESLRRAWTPLNNVDKWYAALTEVANIPGISFSRWSRNDDDMAGIREIVSIVKHALYPSPVGSPSHPT